MPETPQTPRLLSLDSAHQTILSDSIKHASLGNQFSAFFRNILDTSLWPDRWNCGTWSPLHGWMYIISDLLIWLSYFAIPVFAGFLCL